MGKQNKRVKAEAEDDVIFDTEAKKKQKKEPVEVKAVDVFAPNVEQQKKQQQEKRQQQKKEKHQTVGDLTNKVKNEPVEVKAEDVFAPNVEQQKKKQQEKKEKHQTVGDLTNKVKNERVEVKVEGDATPNTKQKKRRQKKKKQQAVGDPNGKVKNERVEVKAEGDVTPNTEQKKKRQRKKRKQQAVGGKSNEVETKPNPPIANAYNGPVSVSVKASEGSPMKKEEKTQIKDKGLAEKNVQGHVVEPASNGAGKKRKRKQKKKQKVVDCNTKIDSVENVSSVTGEKISEGFEAGSKTIAVSGFQSGTKEKKILDHFRGCGFITQINMSNFSEGEKIRELAYIEFKAEDAAKRALGLDGTKMKDRTLKVELSKVQPKKKGPPAKISGCKIAYIGNLPRVVKEDDIKQFFKDSKIESINLALYNYSKKKDLCRGFGHVLFADDESLENAMKKDNVKLYDRPIKVAYPTEKYTEPSKKEGHGV